jgi:hypothetical protein
MAETVVLPLANYPNQTRNFGPITIADSVTVVDFKVQRCTTATPTIWPNASTTLSIMQEISLNGGVSWMPLGGNFSAGGGIQAGKGGVGELAYSQGGGYLPVGVNRQVRGTVVIAGGPLRTTASVVIN